MRTKRFSQDLYLVLIILALSALAHFAFFGRPAETVFDEVHLGKYVASYFKDSYYFDVRPPLGNLLIAFFVYLGGFTGKLNFSAIGIPFADRSYLWFRILPVVAGTLLPLVVYFLARELKFSKTAAFFSAIFIILENSLLSHSRFALVDILLLFFGFLGLWLYFLAKRKKSWLILFLSLISVAFSIGIKWSGLAFLFVILASEIMAFFGQEKKSAFDLIKKSLFVLLIPFLVYFLIFWLHFSLLKKTGEGDAFMSPSFQKTLQGSNYENDNAVKKANLFQKFFELNKKMLEGNFGLTESHPYSSRWYSWPLAQKPILYWNKTINDKQSRIFLVGNPLIYWFSLLGICLLFLWTALDIRFWRVRETTFVLILGFLAGFIPFIPIHRTTFLYYYLPPLVFAIMALCWLIDRLFKEVKVKKIAFLSLNILFLVSFLYFLPLVYGFPFHYPNFIENSLAGRSACQ